MNDSFVFRRVFVDALRGATGEEFKECVMAICDYALDGKEPEGGLAKGFLEITKPYFNVEMQKEMMEEAEIWAEITRKNEEEAAAEEAREKEIWAEVTHEG